MRKFKAIAMSVAAVFVLAAAPVAFAAANQGNPQGDSDNGTAGAAAIACDSRLSATNASGQELFLSTPNPRTYPYAGGAWQNVECATTTFRLAFNQQALVNSNFNAEADCNGTTPTNGQWCQTRALLGLVGGLATEGRPVAAEATGSFAFDGVAGGSGNWQAHSMQRAWNVQCNITAGCQYRFTVQTRMHDSTVTGMRLDDLATTIRITNGPQAPF